MNKIIFFDIQEFDLRNYKRFGVANFLKRNWKVEYWELTKLENDKINKTSNFKSKYVKVLRFNNFFSVLKYILNLKKIFFFIDHTGGLKYAILARFLYFKKCKRITIRERWPSIGLIRIISIFLESGLKNYIKIPFILFDKILNIICNTIIYPKPSLSINSNESQNKKFNFINHNLDYNIFLEKNKKFKSKKNKKSKNIIFVDQGWPLPMDRELRKKSTLGDAKEYWEKINILLTDLKKIYKKNIIIAGNPRRKVDKKNLKYKIIYGDTQNLIKKSFMVVLHNSMAVQFAILWRKPIISLLTKTFPPGEKKAIEDLKRELSIKTIKLEQYDKNELKKINVEKNKYKNFEKNYIFIEEKKNKQSWDILIDQLNIFNKEKYQ